MTPMEKLTAIFAGPQFTPEADKRAMLGSLCGYDWAAEMQRLADWTCDLYNLKADIHAGGVVFTCKGSRSKLPPCITVSLQIGHVHSPSCVAVRFTGSATIQLFEGDADDTELGSGGEGTHCRIETKGRVLLC